MMAKPMKTLDLQYPMINFFDEKYFIHATCDKPFTSKESAGQILPVMTIIAFVQSFVN